MATEPHPHAAYLEIGKVDYDLTAPVLYDFVVLKKGVLVDRNGGAEAVDSLNRLQRRLLREQTSLGPDQPRKIPLERDGGRLELARQQGSKTMSAAMPNSNTARHSGASIFGTDRKGSSAIGGWVAGKGK